MIALTFKDMDGWRHRVSRVGLVSSWDNPHFRLTARCGAESITNALDENANDGAAPATCDECLGVAHLRGWKPHPLNGLLFYRGELGGEHEIANEGELRARWEKEKRGR